MILVTGGTGFIGRRLVATLTGCGRPVRVLTRTPPREPLPGGVDLSVGDVLDPSTLDAALAGVTAVVHLAASVPGSATLPDLFRTNVEGTRNLACAARVHNVAAFIHTSSAGIYGDGRTETPHSERTVPAAQSDYERSKLQSEEALSAALAGSKVRTVVLRPTGVHGPGRIATLEFYRNVQRKALWIHGPARVVVHPTHVDDVVQAVRLALDRNDISGETFNIGGDRAVTYPELIEIVARALGRRITQLTPLPGTLRTGGRLLERGMRLIGAEVPPFVARLSAPIINRAIDTTKARRQLGFEPLPLATGVGDTVDWFRGEGLL